MRSGTLGLAAAVMAVVMTGAVGGAKSAEIPAAAVTEGDQVWTTRCALCHGAGGKGDGPASVSLKPPPRDLTDQKWQASVDDAHIEIIILKGGPAVNLSPMMAANPDLAAKPDVVRALRAKVRSLGSK